MLKSWRNVNNNEVTMVQEPKSLAGSFGATPPPPAAAFMIIAYLTYRTRPEGVDLTNLTLHLCSGHKVGPLDVSARKLRRTLTWPLPVTHAMGLLSFVDVWSERWGSLKLAILLFLIRFIRMNSWAKLFGADCVVEPWCSLVQLDGYDNMLISLQVERSI